MNKVGRPKGSNAIKGELLRSKFIEFLDDNMGQLQEDFNQLTPYERWRTVASVLNRLLPKQVEMTGAEGTPIVFKTEIVGEMPMIDG